MSTVDECLKIQKQDHILHTPARVTTSNKTASPALAASSTATINLVNNTTSNNLYVTVTGLDINNNNTVWLLESDGTTSYYPSNPSANGTALSANVAIEVGAPGSTRTISVPMLTGARIWFSQDAPLVFNLNMGASGPALVEPSVTNTADANYSTKWDFCEFAYNTVQLFVNLSYVDFVSIPVALELTSTDGSATKTVEGLPTDGLATVCEALQAQQVVDCAGWDSLVVQVSSGGSTEYLRALSPNSGIVLNGSLFDGYYQSYVDAVWSQYASSSLTIDTQYTWGTVTGQVDASTNALTFSGVGSLTKPTAANIFNCSTGPFVTSDDELGNICARIAAGFNRSTLLLSADQPSGVTPSQYYQTSPTNHYARILHATNLDGLGYAFPYDDVTPTNGSDQSGAVASSAPDQLYVYIGGGSSSSSRQAKSRSTPIRLREMARPGKQLVGGRGHYRRSVPPEPLTTEEQAVNEKAMMLVQEAMAPFYADEPTVTTAAEAAAAAAAAGRLSEKRDPEKVDLENGLYPRVSAAPPTRRTRLLLLIHQMLLHLWAVLGALGRAVWALVPRSVAVPVAKACSAVAAAPAVKAVVSGVVSVATSAAVRPLLVRGAVAGVLVLVYVAAGASPLVAALITTLAGKDVDAQAAANATVPVLPAGPVAGTLSPIEVTAP